MIRKHSSPIAGHVRVVFELPPGIWADRVFVAGDFNDWDEAGIPMVLTQDGVWQAALDLPAGTRHEFRYRIDGEWRTDYHADGYTSNLHGTENSVVVAELPAGLSRSEVDPTPFQERMAASEVRWKLIQKWRARRDALETAA